MSEKIKLDGIIFGYETLIRSDGVFVALCGRDVPELSKGMSVVLLGDSRGYVPGGFAPGEEVTIVGFTEAFKRGESDHIIHVTNGTKTGWVKPSNIQTNIGRSGPADPAYRRMRQAVSVAFAEFMDVVYLSMSSAERNKLPNETFEFVNSIVSHALQRLSTFGEQLAEAISRVYNGSRAERLIQDPERTNEIESAVLFLDEDGQIVSVKNPEIVWSPSSPSYQYLKGYESYKVLTGALAGRRFFPTERPLGEPRYRPGAVSGEFIAASARSGNAKADSSATGNAADKESVATNTVQERKVVFVSYSHNQNDKRWLARLQVHLKPLERQGKLKIWDDTKIQTGSNWREEIKNAIELARVAVLLVSADFLASDFIANDELPPLLSSAQARGALILPVIVSPCRFAETESLSKFQAVNPPTRPLASMGKAQQEQVFVHIAKAIETKFGETAQNASAG